jgi:hypothetical protein
MRPIEELFTELARLDTRLWSENGRLRYNAPQGALTPELRAEVVERKPEILTFLQKTEALPEVVPHPQERYEPFPLTDVQHAYWVGRSNAFTLGNIATHVYFELDLMEVDVSRLEQAWRQLIQRHDMLRVVFRPDGRQQILASVPLYRIAVIDLIGQDNDTFNQQISDIRAEMSHQVLPTDEWPLFDIRATHLSERYTRLHISMDILITDGMGLMLLFQEWFRCYWDATVELKPLTLTFRDYVLAEKKLEEMSLFRRSEAYWLARLDSLPGAPELPLARDPALITTASPRCRPGA